MLKKIILSFVFSYTFIGFILLPLLVKPQIVNIVEKQTFTKLSIDRFYINPFTFNLELDGVTLDNMKNEHLVSFKSFRINIEPHSLFNQTVKIKEIILNEPKVFIEYFKDKTINLASLLREKTQKIEEKTAAPSEFEMPRVVVDLFKLKDGVIAYKDYTNKKPFEFSLKHLGFELKNIDTYDFDSSDAKIRFHTTLDDGGFVDIKSNVLGFKPLKIDGDIKFEASKLYTQYKYFEDKLGLEVADGKISFKAKYFLNLDDLDSTLINNLHVSLNNLRIKPKNKNLDVLNLNSLDINNVTIKPMKQEVNVGNINLNSLYVKVKMDSDGNIDWLKYLENKTADTNVEDTKVKVEDSNSKAWKVNLDKIFLQKIKVDYDDKKIKPTVFTKLNELNINLENVTLAGEKPFNYNLDLILNEKFKCNSTGSIIHKNLEINSNLECIGFDWLAYKPYINDLAKDALKSSNIKIQNINFQSFKVSDFNLQEKNKIKIKNFNLKSANVSLLDKNVNTKIKLGKINLNSSDISSQKGSYLNYDLSLNLNNKGKISSIGKLSHNPLKQKSKLKIDRISLKEFSPYIGQSLYLNIDDGYFSLNTDLVYEPSKNKSDISLDGKVKLEEFFLSDTRDNSTILSFIKAELNPFNLKLLPNELYVDKAILDAFYIDAQIDENKKINFSKLSKNVKTTNENNITTQSEQSDENKFSYRLMQVGITNGNAYFADYSLPIDFKTSIHDLNGVVYALSNHKDEISYIDIDGEVDEYASTKLSGSVETGNVKSFLDIDFNFRNLSLNNMSGYSAQFAGYKIDDGKLFLDLGYKIYDSELLGKNQVIIKKMKLGDEIEDENISKLPLGFAIALLEDKDGVIDIDMPVEGNLDNPDFKYGALVLKTFVNLIVKAVASPFKFLGSALGIDADNLEYAEFEVGEFKLLPPQKEKLDNVAKIMLKKPKLSFAIVGTYNNITDLDALQTKKLKDLVLLKNNKQANMTIDILEKIFIESLNEKELEKVEIEIKNNFKKKMFHIEYQKELVKRCKGFQVVTQEELVLLANNRAKVLQEYLLNVKAVDKNKIILHEVKESEDDSKNWVKTLLQIEVK